MKTLLTIILILFCAGVKAQEPQTVIYDRSGYRYVKNLDFLDALTITGSPREHTDTADFIAVTMTDLFDYQQECEDSLLKIPIEDIYIQERTPTFINLACKYCETESLYIITCPPSVKPHLNWQLVGHNYVYVQQPTFEGFIEYLKKKYR